MNEMFRRFSARTSAIVGSSGAFIVAVLVIVVWAVTGPVYGYSDTWQLIINTGTTIITFLMVFLIQNTQNRDAKALHLKLDELIKATRGARNHMIDLEELSDEQLQQLEAEYKRICAMGDEVSDESCIGLDAAQEELDERAHERRQESR